MTDTLPSFEDSTKTYITAYRQVAEDLKGIMRQLGQLNKATFSKEGVFFTLDGKKVKMSHEKFRDYLDVMGRGLHAYKDLSQKIPSANYTAGHLYLFMAKHWPEMNVDRASPPIQGLQKEFYITAYACFEKAKEEAAQIGDKTGAFALEQMADFHEKGLGDKPVDLVQTYNLRFEAAQGGSFNALRKLAHMCLKGQGVSPSLHMAYAWMKTAQKKLSPTHAFWAEEVNNCVYAWGTMIQIKHGLPPSLTPPSPDHPLARLGLETLNQQ